MAPPQTVGVTYTGAETPFVDRIYRSRLSFEPGQTREVPAELAAKFLRHADVFQPAWQKDDTAKPKKADQEPAKQQDDTAERLEAARKDEDEHRSKENARFELHQQLDKMDKKALRDWAKVKFQQEFPGNLGEANLRDRVKGLVDQFGAP